MLQTDIREISHEEKIDAIEIAQMARKLPEKEKERFFYMMAGVALMGDALAQMQDVRAGV